MKAAPTLIDTLYQLSFSKTRNRGWTSNDIWRKALFRAKRFILDDAMSTFLGELGTQAFVRDKITKMAPQSVFKIADRLRIGARLPSEITWIEYNLRNCQKRSNELLGNDIDTNEIPAREGWLLMRHPHLPTAFRAHVIAHDPDVDHGDGFDTWTFPVALAWTADDETIIPWRPIPFGETGNRPSEVSTGIGGYITDKAGYVFSDMIVTPNKPMVSKLMSEWAGIQRRIWALLATINDLPVEVRDVRASRGFMGRKNYHRFLDHKTVTLTVPVKHYTKVIRDALAIAHRRGGPVREHWRQDWRRPLSRLCEHEWGADEKHMFCTLCHGRKIWVNEHIRGDTSRGLVEHDFRVTHEVK